MSFAYFMATPVGRALRIVLGLALVLVATTFGTVTAIVLGVLGLAAIAAGAFNVCLISPLIGAPFLGRKALESRQVPPSPAMQPPLP